MNPFAFALRHPITIAVAMVAIIAGGVLSFSRMKVDVFPTLNQPVIYVAQPYGGMDPEQMEGLITNYYESSTTSFTSVASTTSRARTCRVLP